MVSEILKLIPTAIFLGATHVLTGPDHLSAIATLSANVGNCKAFSLGIKWGLGHSFGLVLVAGVLIALSDNTNDEVTLSPYLSHVLSSLVGIFMVLLGVYGIQKAMKKHFGDNNSTIMVGESNELLVNENEDKQQNSLQLVDVELQNSQDAEEHSDNEEKSEARISKSDEGNRIDNYDSETEANLDEFGHSSFTLPKNQWISFLIGIVHGVAGPGGALGVVPAVQLKQVGLSIIYLGTFCLSSTLVMGLYASVYGIFSEKFSSATNFQFQMECFSAGLSIFVGILWLLLISLGKLDDFFPDR